MTTEPHLKRDRRPHGSIKLRPTPKTPQEVADYSGDEVDPQAEYYKKLAKKNKCKEGEDVPDGAMDLVKREKPESGTSDEGDDDTDDEEELEHIEAKPEEFDNMATCFFRDIYCEYTKYTFVYLKRKGKCVNVNINCVPWLIQKLAYYYSIRGNDLPKALTALNEGTKRISQALSEANEKKDLVKEMTKAELD